MPRLGGGETGFRGERDTFSFLLNLAKYYRPIFDAILHLFCLLRDSIISVQLFTSEVADPGERGTQR